MDGSRLVNRILEVSAKHSLPNLDTTANGLEQPGKGRGNQRVKGETEEKQHVTCSRTSKQ